MAKLISSYDLAQYSKVTNMFATPLSVAIREKGALEYYTNSSLNSSGNPTVTSYDLGFACQLVNRAIPEPTTTDARGAGALGGQRDMGILEYNSAIPYHVSPKLVTPYDTAGYSYGINYTISSVIPFQPTTSDARGNTVAFNARTGKDTSDYRPTTTDARGVDAINGYREAGALEYDSTLAIANEFPTVTEAAEAVWQFATSTLKGSDYVEKAGGYMAAQTTLSNVAQGASSTTITLNAGASSTNDIYNNSIIEILAGTGAGQSKRITGYVGSTRVATVGSTWTVTPDGTSVFAILPFVNVGNAVWSETTSSYTTTGTFGKLIQKLLTVSKFLGLK